MKSYWKPQHEVFIRCMLKHEDLTKAYRTAYPKAQTASARVGGIRLFAYPHIRQRIEPILKQRREESHKKALEEGAKRERKARERRLEIRAVLYKVIMKELRRKRVFIVKGQSVIVDDDPPISTRLDALVLDQRLESGYDNWPVIERRFTRIMASLLPREKREHSVTNSLPGLIPASVSISPFEAGRQCAALTGGCGVTRIVDITRMARTSPSAPLKGGTGDILKFSKQPSVDELVNAFEERLIQKQSVTKARAKPAQTHSAAYTKASVQRAVVTKAIYVQASPPPDVGFSSKSV
ncbi:hypothetical protein [Polluticoccus soli]|uniref:hypothetical protein n=1 Tax=Polluticoccus soli TaxID=3034150 RepID=UPI0023E2D1A8|nr:hypothetical protein [Flavipsychrobacter sp. JY13-12]